MRVKWEQVLSEYETEWIQEVTNVGPETKEWHNSSTDITRDKRFCARIHYRHDLALCTSTTASFCRQQFTTLHATTRSTGVVVTALRVWNDLPLNIRVDVLQHNYASRISLLKTAFHNYLYFQFIIFPRRDFYPDLKDKLLSLSVNYISFQIKYYT